MATYDLVELGKWHSEIKSDRAFALSIGLTAQNITDWKSEKSFPSDDNLRKLAKAAKLTFLEAMEYAMEEESSVPTMTKDEFLEDLANGTWKGGALNIREKSGDITSVASRSNGKGEVRFSKKAGFANVYAISGMAAFSLMSLGIVTHSPAIAGLASIATGGMYIM